MQPSIFISSVTSELGSARQAVANELQSMGFQPIWMDIFGTESGDLRQVLREKIDGCNGIIHLAGVAYGAEPPGIDPEFGRVSYTQFEVLYARKRRLKTWVILPSSGFRTDRPLTKLDRPSRGFTGDARAYQSERRQLQNAWKDRLRASSEIYYEVKSETELKLRVRRMKDELGSLRRQSRVFRRVLIGLICVVLVVICFGLLRQENHQGEVLRHQAKVEGDLDGIRERMDAQQERLEESHSRDVRRLVALSEAGADAHKIAHSHPSALTRQHADHLAEILREFRQAVDPSKMTADDDRRIRLAEATIADVDGRYEDALRLVSAEDAESEKEKTEAQIARESGIVLVRAHSLEGLHRWKGALDSYERLTELKPKDLTARTGRARCLSQLGRLKDAEDAWRGLIVELEAVHQHGKKEYAADIGISLVNLAGVLAEKGELTDALETSSAGIDILSRLAQEGDDLQRLVDGVYALNRRADIHAELGDLTSAEEDYETAAELVELLKQKGRLADSNNLSARILSDRATILAERGDYRGAIDCVSKAISIYEEIGKIPFSDDLAVSYENRALMFHAQDDEERAFADFAKALELIEGHAEESQNEYVSLLRASVLRKRGTAYAQRGHAERAMDDLRSAQKIATKLLEKAYHPETAFILACVWGQFGKLLTDSPPTIDNERLQSAVEFHSRALTILDRLTATSPRIVYRQQLGETLINRAISRGRLQNADLARLDLTRAEQVWSDLKDQLGKKEFKYRLAAIKCNRGMVEVPTEPEKGLAELNEGIQLLRECVAEGDEAAQVMLAQCLQVRGRVNGNQKNKEAALSDLNESIDVFSELIETRGHTWLKPQLSRSQRHRREAEEGKPLLDLP